jgi:hypothetical protein
MSFYLKQFGIILGISMFMMTSVATAQTTQTHHNVPIEQLDSGSQFAIATALKVPAENVIHQSHTNETFPDIYNIEKSRNTTAWGSLSHHFTHFDTLSFDSKDQ